MNYIWDLIVLARNSGIPEESIHFRYPKVYSPYIELSLNDLNSSVVQTEVDVNPYYRFEHIFANFFHRDYIDDLELRNQLFDIIIHYLGYVDCLQGMNKQEYYRRFICKDISNGIFGEKIQKYFTHCTKNEKYIITNGVLRYYKIGEGLYIFKQVLKQLFKKSIILANAKEKDEITVFINDKETIEKQCKIEIIQELFVPVHFNVEVYWEHIFGIIDVEEFMCLDETVIY